MHPYVHLSVHVPCKRSSDEVATQIMMKLYKVVEYYLRICIKEYYPSLAC